MKWFLFFAAGLNLMFYILSIKTGDIDEHCFTYALLFLIMARIEMNQK